MFVERLRDPPSSACQVNASGGVAVLVDFLGLAKRVETFEEGHHSGVQLRHEHAIAHWPRDP